MKAFLQSSMTVLLGMCLLYAFYQKKTDRPQQAQAADIAMDSSLFVNQPVFEVKQPSQQRQSAIAAGLPALNPSDSLILLSGIQTNEADSKKKAKLKPRIEIYELKKAPKSNMADTQVIESKLTEVISQKNNESLSEEAATASVSEANAVAESADEQPHVEKKKKFLFFGKKNKDN